MTWFRLHDEVVTDPKVQRLSPVLFKTWINLLCLASRNDGKLPGNMADLAYALRIRTSDAQSKIDALIAMGLFDMSAAGYLVPHNWNGRQFKSDNSTERVRQFRKQRRNVSVTPPDTEQNRADTEQSRTEKTTAVVFSLPEWLPKEPWNDYEEMRKRIRKPMTDKAKQLAINELDKLRKSGHDPGAVLNQSILNSWQGLFELKNGAQSGATSKAQQRHERNDAKYRRVLSEISAGTGGNLPLGDDGRGTRALSGIIEPVRPAGGQGSRKPPDGSSA